MEEKTREFFWFFLQRELLFFTCPREEKGNETFLFLNLNYERERENKAGFSGFQAVNDAARAKSLG